MVGVAPAMEVVTAAEVAAMMDLVVGTVACTHTPMTARQTIGALGAGTTREPLAFAQTNGACVASKHHIEDEGSRGWPCWRVWGASATNGDRVHRLARDKVHVSSLDAGPGWPDGEKGGLWQDGCWQKS